MSHGKILQTENSRTVLTVSEKLEKEPRKFNQFLATLLATLSALCLGMCLVWSSPALHMLEDSVSYPKITRNEGAWIGSLLTLGACVGAMPTGAIANLIGRKRTLQFLSLPLFISWLLIAYGDCAPAFYAARFIAGMAIGGVSVAAPMYVAELSHASIRGTLGTFFQVLITVGVLLEYILGGTILSFHFLAVTSAIFPIIFLLAFSFMPETPIHLYSKGKVEAARKSLRFFRGVHFNCDDELMKIAEDVKEAAGSQMSLGELLSSPVTVKALVLSIGLMVFQQLSGVNAVLFYAANIFAETGSSMSPDTCAIVVGATQVAATLLSTLLIDKTGRKFLLFISALAMAISLTVLGAYFHLSLTQDMSAFSFLPLLSLGAFIVMFSVGLGPVPWILLSELFTPKSKGPASSLSVAINWMLAFTVTNQYQNLNDLVGIGGTFMIFGGICGLGALFIGLLLPETKGRTVEEVQVLLSKKSLGKCWTDV